MLNFPHLTIATFSSQMTALAALDALPADAEVLEYGQRQGGNLTVLIASKSKCVPEKQNGVVDCAFIENVSTELLKGYFKQKSTQVSKNLLVIEAAKLGQLMSFCDALLKTTSFEIIEVSRNPHGPAFAFFANGLADTVPAGSPDVKVELLSNPSKHVLNLFNV